MEIIECAEQSQILATYDVMAQLRPHVERGDYLASMARLEDEGARLIGAFRNGVCLGCAVFRPQFRLALGDIVYVDDLVVEEGDRSSGVGRLLLDWIEEEALTLGAGVCMLDSGVQRAQAHRFYFRQGYAIASYSFRKTLD